jgi:oxygen-independent coproporphyrinogen-3 oxidase
MQQSTQSNEQAVALFIFIPFCKIKCTYCDFNAYANLSRVMAPYADAVAREIGLWGIGAHRGAPLHPKTIYFGGGTPSLVPVAHIEKILRACEYFFTLRPNPEITLEANPGTVDEDKLRALHALGVNRLSLGVQAFDDAVVRRLNRGHTVADALETYDLARRAGFDNINLDFIYGLPLQTLHDWRATLERALALAPEHLSLYALKVEEDTGLEFQIKRGKYPMPDDDLAADMYELTEEMLDAGGYEQYEISNWARRVGAIRESPLRSKHNLTYWHNEPYFGFGAGAHSCYGGERYWNVLSPVKYIQRVERGESVVDGRETISRELEMAETMILGLRLNEGIAFDAFAKRYGEDARERYAAQLHEVQELGLIEMMRPEGSSRPFESGVRLTPRGRLLSNEVFWRMLP